MVDEWLNNRLQGQMTAPGVALPVIAGMQIMASD